MSRHAHYQRNKPELRMECASHRALRHLGRQQQAGQALLSMAIAALTSPFEGGGGLRKGAISTTNS